MRRMEIEENEELAGTNTDMKKIGFSKRFDFCFFAK